MRHHWLSIALFVTHLAAACGPADPDGSRALRSDSAEVEIVLNSGEDRLVEMPLRDEFRLGGDASGPESFFRLYSRDVAVGADGTVAVLNRDAYEVSLFSPTGTHLITVGREGEGPGEFRYPSAIATRPDGEVVVYDYQKRALVRFALDGTVLEQEELPVPFTGRRMVGTEDGLLLLSQTAPRGAGELVQRLMHLVSGDTAQIGPTNVRMAKGVQYETCGVRMTQPPLFSIDLAWGSNGHRTAVVDGAAYSVRIYDDDTLVRVVRRDIAPEPATMAVAERVLGEGERWDIGGRTCTVPVAEVVEARGMAPVVPVVEAVAVTPDGGVWVLRRDRSEGPRVDVFDPTGEYVGTVGSDVPFPVSFLPDGRFVAIETDELDVDRLVVVAVQ